MSEPVKEGGLLAEDAVSTVRRASLSVTADCGAAYGNFGRPVATSLPWRAKLVSTSLSVKAKVTLYPEW